MTDTEFRRLRRKAGVCTRCGKIDAYTMGGRSACAECAAVGRANKRLHDAIPEERQKHYESHRKYQQERREQGLCPTCGRPATPGYSTCPYCRAKHRNYMRQYRNSFQRGQNGICWLCNKTEAVPGRRVCQDCYEKILVAQEKAVAKVAEMKAGGWRHPWSRDDNLLFWKGKRDAG